MLYSICCDKLHKAIRDNWIHVITEEYKLGTLTGKLGLYDREYDGFFEYNLEYCPFCREKMKIKHG